MLTKLSEKVDPKHAVLLIIDMQNDFCHENGAMSQDGMDVSSVRAIVPAMQRLIDGAHRLGLPVVFTQAVHNEWTDSEVRMERHLDRNPICVEGTWGVEFYGVAPTEKDLVIQKARYSAFVGTDLDVVLRTKGIRSVIVTGTATNTCVESTARDAFMRDFYTVAVEDCCAQANMTKHEAALRALEGTFGVVVTAQDVLDAWSSL